MLETHKFSRGLGHSLEFFKGYIGNILLKVLKIRTVLFVWALLVFKFWLSGSTELIESGSNPDPDPKSWISGAILFQGSSAVINRGQFKCSSSNRSHATMSGFPWESLANCNWIFSNIHCMPVQIPTSIYTANCSRLFTFTQSLSALSN